MTSRAGARWPPLLVVLAMVALFLGAVTAAGAAVPHDGGAGVALGTGDAVPTLENVSLRSAEPQARAAAERWTKVRHLGVASVAVVGLAWLAIASWLIPQRRAGAPCVGRRRCVVSRGPPLLLHA